MAKVFLKNKTSGATTWVSPNTRGELSFKAWRAAMTRLAIISVRDDLAAECRPEFVCSANTGKVLHVRFQACV